LWRFPLDAPGLSWESHSKVPTAVQLLKETEVAFYWIFIRVPKLMVMVGRLASGPKLG
jgi:hypothetical protein